MGCCLWGHTELDTTEATQQQQQQQQQDPSKTELLVGMGFFSLFSHFKTKQARTAAFLVYNSLFVLVVLEAARENPPWENNRLFGILSFYLD